VLQDLLLQFVLMKDYICRCFIYLGPTWYHSELRSETI